MSIIAAGLPAATVTLVLVAMGGWFGPRTVMLTVAMLLSVVPSLALKVKESGPA
jgi:hypothetical protein